MTDKIAPVPKYKPGTQLPQKYLALPPKPDPLDERENPAKQTEPGLGKIIDVYA